MKSSLAIRLDEPLDQLINRHPLLAGYFVEHSPGGPDFSRTVQEHLQNRRINRYQLERELQEHLQSAVRPDPEDCETLSCRPLPFCPEDVFDVPSGDVLSLFLSIVRTPMDWISISFRILVRFIEEPFRSIRTR